MSTPSLSSLPSDLPAPLGEPPALRRVPARHRLLSLPFSLYFFIILVLPVSANGLKGALAALVAASTFLLVMARGKLAVGRSTLRVFLLMQATGLLWLLYGLIQNTPGAVFSLLIYLVWPLFYLVVFTEGVSSYRVYRTLRNLMVLTLGLLSAFILYFVLYSFGLAPATPLLELPFGQGLAKYQGFTAMRFYSISSMIFLIPYCISKVVLPASTDSRLRRWVTALVVLLSLAAILFTGRRAALFTLALGLPIALTLAQAAPSDFRIRLTRRFINAALAIALALTVTLTVSDTVRTGIMGVASQVASSLFDPQQTSDDLVRVEQADSLIQGWIQRPLIGAGLGSTTGYIRSERSWNYELQYHMHLFQIGLLGLALYSLGLLWIYRNGLRIIRRGGEASSEMIALLTGLTCFLIANASNPYLQAYGHLWVIFLPAALINLMKKEGEIR